MSLDEDFEVGPGATPSLKKVWQAAANLVKFSIAGRCDMSETARRMHGTFVKPGMPIFNFLKHSRYEEKYGDD